MVADYWHSPAVCVMKIRCNIFRQVSRPRSATSYRGTKRDALQHLIGHPWALSQPLNFFLVPKHLAPLLGSFKEMKEEEKLANDFLSGPWFRLNCGPRHFPQNLWHTQQSKGQL
jgi:hypothetical protein